MPSVARESFGPPQLLCAPLAPKLAATFTRPVASMVSAWYQRVVWKVVALPLRGMGITDYVEASGASAFA